MIAYLSLFLISFVAATIFPLSSELTLLGLLSTNSYNFLSLILTASVGNILGSVFNWFLGFYLLRHIKKKMVPLQQASNLFFLKTI